MMHIRIDNESGRSKRKFACGLGPELPEGDSWVYSGYADCPGCNSNGHQLGTPISELSGRPGHPGYEKFKAIAASWGYD